MYTFGEFSLFSGWNFVQEINTNEGGVEWMITRAFRGGIAAVLFVVVPIMLFLGSIVGIVCSCLRIIKPEVALDEEYD